MPALALYTYHRSSAAYRVRIALNLKALEYEARYIHLLNGGGENFTPEYQAINPQALVPVLQHGDRIVTQSMAICEYLEEEFPQQKLLPEDTATRAQVRSLCNIIACDIHPLNNLRVLQYLESLDIQKEKRDQWYRHWIIQGFHAIETVLAKTSKSFCMADQITLADCFLIPQVYNALRYDCDMQAYANIMRIYHGCMEHEAFQRARPEEQHDAPVELRKE